MSGPSIDPTLYRERDRVPIRRALVAVSDKTGLVELAHALADAGVEIVSTGGTSKAIAEAGVPVTQIGDLTGFPEHLDGRVRTLHPKVHSGLLADLRLEGHEAELAQFGIEPFELLVVNLYPFAETVASGAAPDAVIEQIDIGGPAMVRAAAKNHANVAVVTSPLAYGLVVEALAAGGTTLAERRELARDAFRHTAGYDIGVASWMGSVVAPDDEGSGFPGWTGASWERGDVLRYGENSHQGAALYRSPGAHGIAQAVQHGGKEMSYNNYVDADAALRAAFDHDAPAVAVIKHANPCGIATAATIAEAHALAHACDPVSAYGGVIAANRVITKEAAESIAPIFTEVVVAPGFEPEALEILRAKKNLRLL
jgi:phosphoribosylaminoimidazolecarboxamide formyltransferase/IMP cyclohydrolase